MSIAKITLGALITPTFSLHPECKGLITKGTFWQKQDRQNSEDEIVYADQELHQFQYVLKSHSTLIMMS